MVVDVHLIDTEVECVAGTQRDRTNGIVAAKWASQYIADTGAFSRLEVEAHLIKSTSQFHFVGNVVVHLQQLSVSVRPVGHQQFDIKVVALVQVVCRECALNLNFTVPGNPGVDDDEGDKGQPENHHLEVGNHHANQHERNTAGECE